MRLWHVDLLPVLPRKQLVSQWRECCAIAGSIAKRGTPNHPLVNKVLSSRDDFVVYTAHVIEELHKRGYKISYNARVKFTENVFSNSLTFEHLYRHPKPFPEWFNDRYFFQCYYNLQEKYDCGMIECSDWLKIEHIYNQKLIALSEKL